jgi:hypothetical protein
LCIANGEYCTAVWYTQLGTHSCTSVVMRAVQLCASTRLGCTPVWKVSSHPYSCTDQVTQFVRVYTPYTLKVTPLSHHEPRRGRAEPPQLSRAASTHSAPPAARPPMHDSSTRTGVHPGLRSFARDGRLRCAPFRDSEGVGRYCLLS